MSVYPFYINTDAYGRKSPICGGTRNKDGDMTTTVYQRDEGAITTPFKIRQYSYIDNGTRYLVTDVYYQNEVIKSHTTKY